MPPADADQFLKGLYESAAQGDLDSQLELGISLLPMPDPIPDAHVEFWLSKAADQGSVLAMSLLSDFYLRQGEFYDFDKAKQWAVIAADRGDIGCRIVTELLEAVGPCDKTFVYACIEELAQNNCEDSFDAVILGDSFFKGSYDVDRDMSVAFRLYRYAASKDNAVAMRKLGYMYEHGLGVEQSLEDAAGHYFRASMYDNEAGWLLASLHHRMGMIPIPDWAYEDY